MKKLIMIPFFILIFISTTSAQKDPVDDLFDRYAGKEGITTVFISSRMLSLFSGLTQEDKEVSDLMGRLSSIRILTVDDPGLNSKINLYTELGNKLNFKEYEELMVVNEGSDMVRFLIKETGNKISELLMITTGESNSLISVRGDIDLKSISSLSQTMGIEELERLEGVKRKEVIKK
ncbi:MAG: DUF4252 domain-containing protein [Bacteroidales bacterium]|nr:DUF4252 domain-containing protein [Bacteroidales bacterium]